MSSLVSYILDQTRPLAANASSLDKVVHSAISTFRGLQAGISTGIRVRQPYIYQAFISALLAKGEAKTLDRFKFTITQMLHHAKNLGTYVAIYKAICFILRRGFGLSNGLDSWIAGSIGGFYAFGESKGISGSVNYQIVLYLFARGIEGTVRSMVKRGYLPKDADPRTPKGFRYFAALSLALALYLTEYEPDMLRESFLTTMNELYHTSDSGNVVPRSTKSKIVVLGILALSLVGYFVPWMSIDTLMKKVDFSAILKSIGMSPKAAAAKPSAPSVPSSSR